ncbi:hypothetical protein HK097_010738 [Rhizophlyctis rosea]|uniref:Enoyl reductase (ER) domain-containing protein n=1 Tax=Rhizophlyctis rosea TaxID=64517 RepID=A0AAD5S8M6_9FUNG|nr:hypothetical protein HK097_010738 [Rhizophlyctis rosea]
MTTEIPTTMRAYLHSAYGPPTELKPTTIPTPNPPAKAVLIRVHSLSLNASDIEFLTGSPAYTRIMGGITKPKPNFVLGSDIAGVVVKVGEGVTDFKVGDEVMGDILEWFGGFAEYVIAPVDWLIKKPEWMSWQEASAIPQAAVVALQGIRKGGVKEGSKVLINGAGGGAGSFAIQFAKLAGAHVAAVDSGLKGDVMRELGADVVVDYKMEDFAASTSVQYDYILDFVASSGRSLSAVKSVLTPAGQYVLVGGPVAKILESAVVAPLLNMFGSKKAGMLLHVKSKADMEEICGMRKEAKIKIVVEKVYKFEDLVEAVSVVAEGRNRGKIVVHVAAST